jgi:hypothetical protein
MGSNDTIDSTLLVIETLQKEYDVTLQQYQEAVNNYISLLETNTGKEYTALKGRAWWGTNALSEKRVDTQKDCENMCAASEQCSGATFNTVSRYCWTRSGNSSLTVGQDEDYALITKIKASLETMNYLNNKLLGLNKQISEQIASIQPLVDADQQINSEQQQNLESNYEKLLEQNIEVNKQLEEYYSVDEARENEELFVKQENGIYKIWIIITGLVLIFTIRKLIGSENPSVSAVFWIIVLILLVVLTYGLNRPSGFFIWFMVLMIIIFMKTNTIPSP